MNILSYDLAEITPSHAQQAGALLQEAYGDEPSSDEEPPLPDPDRVFLALDPTDTVIGHLSAYVREVEIAGAPHTIGMIGDVATRRTHRRQGVARSLVSAAHGYFRTRALLYAVLFAYDPPVYRSSGYALITDRTHYLSHDGTWKTRALDGSMYAELTDQPWPAGLIDLKGRPV